MITNATIIVSCSLSERISFADDYVEVFLCVRLPLRVLHTFGLVCVVCEAEGGVHDLSLLLHEQHDRLGGGQLGLSLQVLAEMADAGVRRHLDLDLRLVDLSSNLHELPRGVPFIHR